MLDELCEFFDLYFSDSPFKFHEDYQDINTHSSVIKYLFKILCILLVYLQPNSIQTKVPTLNWIGKEKVVHHHQDVPFRVLEHRYGFTQKGEQKKPTNSGNLIIHGDNLEALKALLPEYEGRVDVIYIDPPYNTGKENWKYNDNVNHPQIKKWLGQVVGSETEDLSRHDKWLCMMYPRVKLLHKLLSENGAIAISLDDNEVFYFKILLDEVFGRLNFVQNIIWKKRSGPPNDKDIAATHEYILLYSKSYKTAKFNRKKRSEEQENRYSNPDNHPKGKWAADNLMANVKGGRYVESLYFPIVNPNTNEEHYPSSNGNWRYNKEKIKKLLENKEIYFGKDGKGRPKLKRFLIDVNSGVPYSTTWDYLPHNNAASKEIADILGSLNIFDTPKPTKLIEEVLNLISSPNSIILDSYAGSGTTAHAVLNLNKQDGGNRKFICIEMEDYAETITAERVKRVIKGYGNTEGTDGSFDYYELGKPLFKKNGYLNEAVNEEKIRNYIYYTETKQPLCKIRSKENWYLLDHYNNTAYYFYYEKNQLTTLDLEGLSIVKEKAEQYIIYADNCLLDQEYMLKHNIIFKKIPRDIKRF